MTCVAYLGPDSEDHSATTLTWMGPSGQQLINDSASLVTVYTETVSQNGQIFLESILEICSMGLSGVGEYTCRASNTVGDDTFRWNISFTEEIVAPQLIATPVSQDVNYGHTVLMACVANGYPEPEIIWSRNGQVLDPDSSDLVNVYTQVVTEMGLNFTESILEICGVGADDIGSFMCIATSDVGTANSSTWTIGILPSELGLPCLLYTSPSPRDATLSRMPSSA